MQLGSPQRQPAINNLTLLALTTTLMVTFCISFIGVEKDNHLTEILDRHPTTVTNYMNMLHGMGILKFEADGRSKVPRLAVKNVEIKPIVKSGKVQYMSNDQ